MTPYKNLSGNSGVTAYEITERGIRVQFNGGPVYHYLSCIDGVETVASMSSMAETGRGLSTFIAQNKKTLKPEKE